MALTEAQVTDALRTVIEPELFKDIVTLGLVKSIKLSGDDVDVAVTLASANATTKAKIQADATQAIERLGAGFVRLTVTEPTARTAGASGAKTQGGAAGGGGAGGGAGGASELPQVKHVIAVGAGKGGVGKSTVAVNLAIGLQRRGLRVGLMDGDIYGPSLPTMLGLAGQTPGVADVGGTRRIRPLLVHGIHVITIGSLVEAEKPLMWRGPMAHGAFKQLLLDNTQWPDLDVLVIDLPPGTGDVPISLCQMLPLAGAVVVATPQQVALDDAIRAARMFQQLGAPILGVVENMSFFVDETGKEHDIFGRGGAKAAAERLGVPFLGEVPMFTALRANSDAGKPHKNFEGDARLRDALEAMVSAFDAELKRIASTPGVTLEIE